MSFPDGAHADTIIRTLVDEFKRNLVIDDTRAVDSTLIEASSKTMVAGLSWNDVDK